MNTSYILKTRFQIQNLDRYQNGVRSKDNPPTIQYADTFYIIQNIIQYYKKINRYLYADISYNIICGYFLYYIQTNDIQHNIKKDRYLYRYNHFHTTKCASVKIKNSISFTVLCVLCVYISNIYTYMYIYIASYGKEPSYGRLKQNPLKNGIITKMNDRCIKRTNKMQSNMYYIILSKYYIIKYYIYYGILYEWKSLCRVIRG
eukprot:TRINITY_DN6640_c1_g1_i2.p3 TRINITY_DN6640_c1_g1~~TRINITY_DN6640_c1_g1_i2.p3  ORF type:complete len:203 (-),score=-17.88 TRINITY_DN6640_c1_g1_i2:538-1146(-)